MMIVRIRLIVSPLGLGLIYSTILTNFYITCGGALMPNKCNAFCIVMRAALVNASRAVLISSSAFKTGH